VLLYAKGVARASNHSNSSAAGHGAESCGSVQIERRSIMSLWTSVVMILIVHTRSRISYQLEMCNACKEARCVTGEGGIGACSAALVIIIILRVMP
jgi:hypothetical protein